MVRTRVKQFTRSPTPSQVLPRTIRVLKKLPTGGTFLCSCCGGRTCTCDLKVMSLASYYCSTPLLQMYYKDAFSTIWAAISQGKLFNNLELLEHVPVQADYPFGLASVQWERGSFVRDIVPDFVRLPRLVNV